LLEFSDHSTSTPVGYIIRYKDLLEITTNGSVVTEALQQLEKMRGEIQQQQQQQTTTQSNKVGEEQ